MATPPSIARPRPTEGEPVVGLPRATIVVGGDGIHGAGGYFVPRLPTTLRGLGQLVGPLGPRPEVWVHETAFGQLGMLGNSPSEHTPPPGRLFDDVGGYRLRVTPREWAWTAWQAPESRFDLHVPAWGRGSPFGGLGTARELVDAVGAYYGAGGPPWRGWGTMTSDTLLRPRARPTGLPEPLGTGQVREAPIQWSRAPADDEHGYRWLHGLDVNGAHLAVAGSIPLPAGEPEHRDLPPFDKALPGVWLVDLPTEWDDDRFPPPWGADYGGEGWAWVTTPTMERIVQECGEVPIVEAWTWPEHGHYLRRWQAQLRDARAALIEAGQWHRAPGAAVKAIYQTGPGRLGSRDRAKSPPESDALFQPYWWAAIIAESRCRLHRRMRALDVRPVAVYRDAVYFLSSRATPVMLAQALGLPTGDRLGGFKGAGTISAKTARQVLTEGRGSAAGTAEALFKIVRANNGD